MLQYQPLGCYPDGWVRIGLRLTKWKAAKIIPFTFRLPIIQVLTLKIFFCSYAKIWKFYLTARLKMIQERMLWLLRKPKKVVAPLRKVSSLEQRRWCLIGNRFFPSKHLSSEKGKQVLGGSRRWVTLRTSGGIRSTCYELSVPCSFLGRNLCNTENWIML